MSIKFYVIGPVVFLVTVTIIDLVWLGVVAKDVYRDALGKVMRKEILVPAAAIFYALFAMGALYFVVSPAVIAGEPFQALWRGALLGFFGYQLYDLTNLAIIQGWPLKLAIIDIAWGTFLTGTSSWVTTIVLHELD